MASEDWPFFIGTSTTPAELLNRIEDGAFFGEGEENFWIVHNDEKIGLIELYELNELAPMFSLRLLNNYRGKGLGKPCLEWLTKHVFDNYPDKKRIEGQTREDNVVMRRLFNKCGYMKEAYY